MRIGGLAVVVFCGLLEDDKAFLGACDNSTRLFVLEAEVSEDWVENNLELSGLYTNVLLLLILYLAAALGVMK